MIVISEFMNEDAVRLLAARHKVVYRPELVDDRPALLAAVSKAQALIVRNRTQVDAEILAAAPRLSVVGRLGVGLDNIDTHACRLHQVRVIPATGANAQAVAEYVITTAMMLLRGCYGLSEAVAAGDWPRTAASSGRELSGKTLGLLGFGGIGRLVARLAGAFGTRVVAHDPGVTDDDSAWKELGVRAETLDHVLEHSDVLSLHLPLTDSTRALLNSARIARMKAGSVLINTSRGGIVDEAALADALRRGHLAGAALDVFAREPLPASPAMQSVPGLILTPHIAGVTHESNERVSDMIARAVIDHLAGTH